MCVAPLRSVPGAIATGTMTPVVNTAKLVKSYVQAALGLFCGFKFLLQAQRTGSDPEQAPAQQIRTGRVSTG